MNKPDVRKITRSVGTELSKRAPGILTGIGIGGLLATTVLAVKATPKALELIEEEKNRQNRELIKEAEAAGQDNVAQVSRLKPVEVVKVAWKPYIPAIVTGVFSTACLIGASSVNARRNAALATAYKLAETTLSDYKEKVIEEIGESKEKKIRDAVAKDKIERNPTAKTEILVTEKGNTLCYDTISGRYFKSDLEKIRKAVNDLNRRMVYENYISLTELYSELGLSPTSISDQLGWNLDSGLIEVDYSSQIADDGTPCIVVDYMVEPRYDFSCLY